MANFQAERDFKVLKVQHFVFIHISGLLECFLSAVSSEELGSQNFFFHFAYNHSTLLPLKM